LIKVQAVKYLFKYIYKGHDKAQACFESTENSLKSVDEITEFLDARYISAIEGVWHIFHFQMHGQSPPVVRLDTHLEDQNTFVFKDGDKISDLKKIDKKTKLTAWFELNKTDSEARKHLYHDIPKFYVWKQNCLAWQKRKNNKMSNMIGRMYFISPNDTERFSMRLLLLNKPGAVSFQDLKTYENVEYKSFQECAVVYGLLADDKTWNDSLVEATNFSTDVNKLRLLFVMILVYGQPSNPAKLWETHKENLTRDILYKERIRLNNCNLNFNEDMFMLCLYFINESLLTYNRSLANYKNMPQLTPNYNPNNTILNDHETNRYIRRETDYDKSALKLFSEACEKTLNSDQLKIYNTLINSDDKIQPNGKLYFLDGPGGKTTMTTLFLN
jgi:hypothetical protein